MELLIGFLLGISIASLVATHMLRRYVRNKVALRSLISEMYHKDLLPEICRAEGLVYLATRENHHEYAKMALKEIQLHKKKGTGTNRKISQVSMILRSQLIQCMPFASSKRIDMFLEPLNQVMDLYAINSFHRITAFLAQLAHESGSLVYVKEIATGNAYEGRKDLGNIHPGDGQKYKGRGLIQITGRANYQALTDHFKVDFINNPALLEQPLYACLSAGWFWDKMKLNALADQVTEDAFKKITKKINGGLNGYEDRVSHWRRCKVALV